MAVDWFCDPADGAETGRGVIPKIRAQESDGRGLTCKSLIII